MYYNKNGIFKIPNNENNNLKKIQIQNSRYQLTNKSAILFQPVITPNTIVEHNVIDSNFNYIVVYVNDGQPLFKMDNSSEFINVS